MTDTYKIGSSLVGITAFASLSTPVKLPYRSVFHDQVDIVLTGDLTSVARGAPYIEMKWKDIVRAQRDQLRSFCSGVSATVFIMLPINDSNAAFHTYQAIMTWPNTENPYINIIPDFTLLFYALVFQS